MKKEKLIDAITDIEPDVLDRYFDMKKGFSERKKPHKHGWIKWVVIAACLSLLVTTAFAAASDNNQPYKKPDENKGTELAAEDALVVALVEYLNELEVDHDMPAITTADKMDAIRDGQQALHVAFDSSKPYFVCAYSVDGQQSGEYTWLKYANVGDITKEYEDLQMALAFQINPSLFVKDIMTEDATVPTMEHFQPYEPQFNEGLNTKAADTFDETFIYLNSSEENAVYYSTTAYDHEWVSVPCIYLKGEYYVHKHQYSILPDGTNNKIDLSADLGIYLEGMYLLREETNYSFANADGSTAYFKLVKIDNFSKVVESAIEKNEELRNFFSYMEKEAESKKIDFEIFNQFGHYIYENSNVNSTRSSPKIYFTVTFDFNHAINEDWYKACADKDAKTLKTAFLNAYSDKLFEEYYEITSGSSRLYFLCEHTDDHYAAQLSLSEALDIFYSDYEIFKELLDEEYVVEICVEYYYSASGWSDG